MLGGSSSSDRPFRFRFLELATGGGGGDAWLVDAAACGAGTTLKNVFKDCAIFFLSGSHGFVGFFLFF
jgi:hypothetical protein